MSSHHLEFLLKPRSVAVIGASDRPRSVGAKVLANLLAGGFAGPVWPVNARHASVAGRTAYRTVAALPATPDLAVICTPAPSVPGLIAELGARGTRAAIVLSAGLEQVGADGTPLGAAMLAAARPCALRILGPNCIGLLAPGIGLNASFAHLGARSGPLAFIAQSGALTTAMLDWADSAQVGFSYFVSLGNAADVDFGDLIDWLGRDAQTRAILLYVEAVTAARKFMSAARAAARNKPVIVVKAGRSGAAARAATSHSGALAGSDAVYEAAFRRAGLLRVGTTRELFDAAQILARVKSYAGPRLAILSNGGGPGVMATDALIGGGGELAQLSDATLRMLDALLPREWSRGNPLDIVGDARPERYVGALHALLADPQVDGVLLIHAPTAIASAPEVAQACAPELAAAPRPVITCWLGGEGAARAATRSAAAGVPAYSTPEEAVSAFLYLARYHRNQQLLMQTPPSIPEEFVPNVALVRALVAGALEAGRLTLTEPEAKAVLAAYAIPVVETRIARDLTELAATAAAIGYPVALKILSPEITHKSDVGGVALGLESAAELEHAGTAMLARCRELKPAARIEGFTVQRMIRRGGAYELIVGIALDATFGPIVLFGQGGVAVEVVGDRALALPPLNRALARDVIGQTRVYRLLAGYRDRAPADLEALELVLVKLSQLAADVPQIVELDVNPLLADEHGVLALDARIRLAPSTLAGTQRFAIRPYPKELEEWVELDGRRVLLRPIRPEDQPQHVRFLARVSPEDLRARFLCAVRELSADELAHLTQIDYEREMAFLATARVENGQDETLAVARACADADNEEAEFAVLVRSDLKARGLGTLLMRKLIDYCRARGTRRLVGEALSDNARMIELAGTLGFRVESPQEGIVRMSLELTPAASAQR